MNQSIVLERSLSPEQKAQDAGLERRRVYIFLTRHGFLFALSLTVMLLGAVNYSNSMAYGLTFLLAGLFFVCMLHTYRNLRGLVVQFQEIPPGYGGGGVTVPVLFDNRAGAARVALCVKPHPKARAARPANAAATFSIPAGDFRQVDVPIATPRRGVFRLERLLLYSSYPLGLFEAWSYLDTHPPYIVYPRAAGSRQLPPLREHATQNQIGQQPGSDDFSGFRPYRPGDSIRNVDWKAYARQHVLLSKRFVGTGSRKLTLGWDSLPAALNVEARLSQLCLWVLSAERLGHLYALEIPGHAVAHGSGAAHRRSCLELLARF